MLNRWLGSSRDMTAETHAIHLAHELIKVQVIHSGMLKFCAFRDEYIRVGQMDLLKDVILISSWLSFV
jgi:hypothetical protein